MSLNYYFVLNFVCNKCCLVCVSLCFHFIFYYVFYYIFLHVIMCVYFYLFYFFICMNLRSQSPICIPCLPVLSQPTHTFVHHTLPLLSNVSSIPFWMTKLLLSLFHTRHAHTSPLVYFTNLVPSPTGSHASTCFTHFTSLGTSRFEPTWTGRGHLLAIMRKGFNLSQREKDEEGDKRGRTERTQEVLPSLIFTKKKPTGKRPRFFLSLIPLRGNDNWLFFFSQGELYE